MPFWDNRLPFVKVSNIIHLAKKRERKGKKKTNLPIPQVVKVKPSRKFLQLVCPFPAQICPSLTMIILWNRSTVDTWAFSKVLWWFICALSLSSHILRKNSLFLCLHLAQNLAGKYLRSICWFITCSKLHSCRHTRKLFYNRSGGFFVIWQRWSTQRKRFKG